MSTTREDYVNHPISPTSTLMQFKRRAAGHKMTTKIPILHSDNTVSDARQLVIENAEQFDTINYLYIVSKNKKLKGVVNIKDIFRKEPDTSLSEIMQNKVVKAHIDTDYEKAAHLALKNNIKAVPLVDKKGHLIGILSSDQVLSIVEKESREDLMKMSGIIMGRGTLPSGDILESPITSFYNRAPWILIGLLGAMFTAEVISNFEGLLSQHIILASFIPLVAYVSNAAGNQTQTLLIRDLATQPKFSLINYGLKQYVTSTLIGLSCLITLMTITFLLWADMYIGMVVGISIFISILVSTTMALFVPKLLMKLDLDPATGAGPFSTVIQDFMSVVIYLAVASVLI